MATFEILFTGYLRDEGDESPVASTVSLVRAGDARIVIDPGMVPSPESILGPLRESGLATEDVTDVILSHHHPDHTLNTALFPRASVHDQWAIYRGDRWLDRQAEGAIVAVGVHLIETPGHTQHDITTLVTTDDGVVAFTHLWWDETGPLEDPYAVDPVTLHQGRLRVIEAADHIVPAHGPMFAVGNETPH